MNPRIEIPADKRQQAYDYYARQPSVSLQNIATFLGVSLSTLYRLRDRWRWPLREVALAQQGDLPEDTVGPPARMTSEEAVAPLSLREAALSLAKVTRSHIDALVKEQRTGLATDHDKTARALASYAKTLTTAHGLLEQEGSRLDDTGTGHHDDDPRSIHELRDELARHLERVVAEEEARGSDGLLV